MADLSEYRIGVDGETDYNNRPYVRHEPCGQEISSGRNSSGGRLNLAEVMQAIVAHRCDGSAAVHITIHPAPTRTEEPVRPIVVVDPRGGGAWRVR